MWKLFKDNSYGRRGGLLFPEDLSRILPDKEQDDGFIKVI